MLSGLFTFICLDLLWDSQTFNDVKSFGKASFLKHVNNKDAAKISETGQHICAVWIFLEKICSIMTNMYMWIISMS